MDGEKFLHAGDDLPLRCAGERYLEDTDLFNPGAHQSRSILQIPKSIQRLVGSQSEPLRFADSRSAVASLSVVHQTESLSVTAGSVSASEANYETDKVVQNETVHHHCCENTSATFGLAL